jgi:hypothetical protein
VTTERATGATSSANLVAKKTPKHEILGHKVETLQKSHGHSFEDTTSIFGHDVEGYYPNFGFFSQGSGVLSLFLANF